MKQFMRQVRRRRGAKSPTQKKADFSHVDFSKVLVEAPKVTERKPVKSNDPALPYVGTYIAPLHKWFVDVTLDNVVAAVLNEIDHGNGGFGYGASEIGSQFPIYLMATGTKNKRQVGTLSYNGNVALTEVLS